MEALHTKYLGTYGRLLCSTRATQMDPFVPGEYSFRYHWQIPDFWGHPTEDFQRGQRVA